MVLGVWNKVYVIAFRIYGFKVHGLGFNVWCLQYNVSNPKPHGQIIVDG
jgi:hypothetical protein